MSNENKIDDIKAVQVTEKPFGMGRFGFEGDSVGRESRGPEDDHPQESDSRGPFRKDPPELRDHIGPGSSARIPGTRVTDPSDTLLQAFLDGDFEKAYRAAEDLRAAYHEALNEGARLRYRVNFGTEVCNRCEGLKAGPGVIATCFQVQKCNFDSIHEGSESPLHLKILDRLL
jgi:hypothetical protein